MSEPCDCLGVIETRGMWTALEAADTMLKSKRLQLVGLYLMGDSHVAVVVRGTTGPVQAAIEAGAVAAGRKGEVLGRNVIPRCDKDLTRCLAALCRHPVSLEDPWSTAPAGKESADSIPTPAEDRASKNPSKDKVI